MTVEEVRRRLVEEELAAYRQARRRDAVLGAVAALLVGVMVAVVAPPAAEWPRGRWLQPGGWLHDRLGFEASVALVRGGVVLALLAALAWMAWSLHAGTRGLARRRARIEREQPRLRRPGELA